MIDHKKIAGILCETVPFPMGYGVVVGVGLNINMQADILQSIDQPATSMKEETQKEWIIGEIAKELAANFSSALDCFLKRGFQDFLPKFRKAIIAKKLL